MQSDIVCCGIAGIEEDRGRGYKGRSYPAFLGGLSLGA